ncbi:MAG: type II toxin-antitoxin system RelE/ParE family toxin [Betaproteobacteria bacterium]|nr:type II toxin-antitoxin system RelE/ParE family toxin [Betaproteobacteria bacterium]
MITPLSLLDLRAKNCGRSIRRWPFDFSSASTLVQNPRPAGAVKLEGATDLWRIIYRIADRERLIDIVAVRHRREAYR